MGLLHYLLPCSTQPAWQPLLGVLGPHGDSWDPRGDSRDPSRCSAPRCVLWDSTQAQQQPGGGECWGCQGEEAPPGQDLELLLPPSFGVTVSHHGAQA